MSRPTAHVDHVGGFGAGTGITDAQPPFSANSEDFGKVDHAGFRRGGPRGGRSRSCSQVCASLGHHQSPFPRNVAGQGPPGHVARFKLVTLRGEHVPTLEAETGPRAGQVNSVVRIHLDHAASSSLSGEPAGRQEPSQSRSHCQAEPTNRIRPDMALRIMYIMFDAAWLAGAVLAAASAPTLAWSLIVRDRKLTGPWAAFSFKGGRLVTPEGRELEPQDLAWLSLTAAQAQEWLRPMETRGVPANRDVLAKNQRRSPRVMAGPDAEPAAAVLPIPGPRSRQRV